MKKLDPVFAFIVFLSGYSPLWLVLALLDFNFETGLPNSPWLIGSLFVIFAGCCIFTWCHFTKYDEGDPVTVIDIEDKSSDLVNYGIPYIAGFAGSDVASLGKLLAIGVVLLVVFFVTYRTQSVVVNPFLVARGYRMSSATIIFKSGYRQRATVLSTDRDPIEEKGSYFFTPIADCCYIRTRRRNPLQSSNAPNRLP